jgi:hypothetical protein
MSYRVPDQFETEPNAFYSGSYTDGVFLGTMSSSSGRFRAASCASGSNELIYATRYSDFADHSGSNRNRSLGYGQRFRTFFSSTEQYQDTILPDSYYAYLVNGGTPILAKVEAQDAGARILVTDQFAGIPVNYPVAKLLFTTPSASALLTPTSGNVADTIWFGSFPFQGRYRNVEKNVNGTFFKPSVGCPVTESQGTGYDGIIQYGTNTSYMSSSLATVSVIIPYLWIHRANSGFVSTQPIRYTLIDVVGTTSASGDQTFLGLGTVGNPFPPPSNVFFGNGNGTVIPTNKQLVGFLFGFGDNYMGVPIISAITSSLIMNTVGVMNLSYGTSVDIRGWRYGVVNGLPYYASCVYRSNRYGQFRDMMEQRKTTKFYDPNGFTADGKNNAKKGATSAVVNVAFVSGSEAYVTASLASTLNLNDSGLYDFECKSGQPWFDV